MNSLTEEEDEIYKRHCNAAKFALTQNHTNIYDRLLEIQKEREEWKRIAISSLMRARLETFLDAKDKRNPTKSKKCRNIFDSRSKYINYGAITNAVEVQETHKLDQSFLEQKGVQLYKSLSGAIHHTKPGSTTEVGRLDLPSPEDYYLLKYLFADIKNPTTSSKYPFSYCDDDPEFKSFVVFK